MSGWTDDSFLVDRLDPIVRATLVECRILGMEGRLDAALARLNEHLRGSESHATVFDQVALTMLKAELSHLDGRDDEALQIFRSTLDLRLDNLPPDIGLIVRINRNEVAFSLTTPDSLDDFFRIVDERSVASLAWHDAEALVSAEEAVREDKHHEALPAMWREFLQTYRQGYWKAWRWAAKRLARETLQVGLLPEAVFYTILAQHTRLASELAEEILRRREPENLRQAVEKVLGSANLSRHFCTACEILKGLGDAIPEDQLQPVLDWLLRRAGTAVDGLHTQQVVVRTWEALRALGPRLDHANARSLVLAAVSHPSWISPLQSPNAVIPERKELVEAVESCLGSLTTDDLSTIAQHTLPLITERRQSADYPQVIRLLCQVVQRGGERVQQFVVEALYPPGQPVRDSFLAQAAPLFGKKVADTSMLPETASQVARNVRLQVQRLPADREPEIVNGSLLRFTYPLGAEKVVIQMVQTVDLEAVFSHREHLPPHSLQAVIDAVLDMVRERENFLSNKTGLVYAMRKVGDSVTPDMARAIFATLAPLARGEILEPTLVMTAAEAQHPLNPYRMNTGSPPQLRGVCLYVLARMEKDRRGLFDKKLGPLLVPALEDSDPDVRRYAFAAAREWPDLPETALGTVLLGTQDREPATAVAAFAAIGGKDGLQLTRGQAEMLHSSLRMMIRSPAVAVRRAVAATAARLLTRETRKGLAQQLRVVLDCCATDLCHSVRKAAQPPEP